MQQADRNPFDLALAQELELRASLVFVEWDEHLAVSGEAFPDTPAQIAGDERTRDVTRRAPPRQVGQRLERTP